MKRIVLMLVVALAGALFVGSMLSPFVSASFGPKRPGVYVGVNGAFWSFKGDAQLWVFRWWLGAEGLNVSTSERWFGDLWSVRNSTDHLPTAWAWIVVGLRYPEIDILIIVFVAQLVTLGLAAGVLLLRRLMLRLLLGTVVSAFTTVVGMGVFGQVILGSYSFELGFWLALISGLLFTAVLIVSMADSR